MAAPPHNALGPLRLALLKPPETANDRPDPVYRVSCRREQAEALLSFCEAAADILVTFPRRGVASGRRTARARGERHRGWAAADMTIEI